MNRPVSETEMASQTALASHAELAGQSFRRHSQAGTGGSNDHQCQPQD